MSTRPGGPALGRVHSALENTGGLCVSPIQPSPVGPQQSNDGPDGDSPHSSSLAEPTVVASTAVTTGQGSRLASKQRNPTERPIRSIENAPNVPPSTPGCISYLKQRYETEGLPPHVANLLVSAARTSTHKTYDSGWKRWCSWCYSRQINPFSTTLNNILIFLADTYESGLQYRSINVLRSALSSTLPRVDGYPVGQHPYVLNLMKGILNNRPPKPRYTYTWDVHTVTHYLKQLGDNNDLSLKQLSLKLATLLALTCPKRVSSLSHLDLNHYRSRPEGLSFHLPSTKSTRPDETVSAFFTCFPENKRLCPVECFQRYLSVTSCHRITENNQPKKVFISYIKPHKPVTTATLARWIRSLLTQAGIDTNIFKAHSVRGAATSAAAKGSVPLEEILNMADWSNASTFKQFYYKPVMASTFGRAVLTD